jgi:hypothetical protein
MRGKMGGTVGKQTARVFVVGGVLLANVGMIVWGPIPPHFKFWTIVPLVLIVVGVLGGGSRLSGDR